MRSLFPFPLPLPLILLSLVLLSSFEGGSSAPPKKDYYEILGIDRSATDQEIRRSFRALSRKYHPDKNVGNEEANARFIEVNEASTVLSNKETRRIYDRHGHAGIERHNSGQGQQAQSHSMFADFFGGAFGQQPGGQKRGPDIHMPLVISLADVYVGRPMNVLVHGQQVCPHCRGSGADSHKDMKKCPDCDGQGVRIVNHMLAPGMYQRVQQTCERCGGHGQIVKRKCHVCKGKKIVSGQKLLHVYIERGIPDGHEIVFENEADESPDVNAGHIIFKVKTVKDAVFARKGNNLHMKLDVPLIDSLLGFETSLKHLDGHVVDVQRSGITRPQSSITIRGEGMPHHEHPSKTGNLIATANILFPDTLTVEQRNVIEKIFPTI